MPVAEPHFEPTDFQDLQPKGFHQEAWLTPVYTDKLYSTSYACTVIHGGAMTCQAERQRQRLVKIKASRELGGTLLPPRLGNSLRRSLLLQRAGWGWLSSDNLGSPVKWMPRELYTRMTTSIDYSMHVWIVEAISVIIYLNMLVWARDMYREWGRMECVSSMLHSVIKGSKESMPSWSWWCKLLG